MPSHYHICIVKLSSLNGSIDNQFALKDQTTTNRQTSEDYKSKSIRLIVLHVIQSRIPNFRCRLEVAIIF